MNISVAITTANATNATVRAVNSAVTGTEGIDLIIINNGHNDYIFASQKKARKLKYICRLFAKELVLQNFMGFETEDLLERMIELMLYTEEHLR